MQDLLLAPAGVVVGIINAVAGGGSLVSFPLFLLLGYSPFVANVSNSVGVFPSNFGGLYGYRDELKADRKTAWSLVTAVTLGTAGGAAILLLTGEAVFVAVVPWIIVAGSLMMAAQPWLVKHIKSAHAHRHARLAFVVAFIVGIYGGYFGPGIGVMLMAVFGTFVSERLQKVNALKNAAAFCNNLLCVIVFAIFADIAWTAALAMAAGTLVGGFAGTHVAKKLPDKVFRAIVVAIGLAAAAGVAIAH